MRKIETRLDDQNQINASEIKLQMKCCKKKCTFCSALTKPNLGVRGLDSAAVHAPGGINRGFFIALPRSWLGAPDRRILLLPTRNNLSPRNRMQ